MDITAHAITCTQVLTSSKYISKQTKLSRTIHAIHMLLTNRGSEKACYGRINIGAFRLVLLSWVSTPSRYKSKYTCYVQYRCSLQTGAQKRPAKAISTQEHFGSFC
eukprot:1161720-Pelagomonas_calceolata.AAC.4